MKLLVNRILLITVALFFFQNSTKAQSTGPFYGWGIETTVFEGKIIKHTKKFHAPIPDRSNGIDVNFTYHTFGKKEWEQRRHYPFLGIGICYTNYGIDSVYGRCLSLFPNLTIPIISGKKMEWTIRIGDGIGYVTKHYGRIPISDTLNNVIGSHINDYASFHTDFRYHGSPKWDFQAGVNFSHISDASFHQPNLGVNLVGAHVGFRYFPNTSTPVKIHHDLKPLRGRILFQGRVGLAFTQSEAPSGPLYPVYLASAYASKRWKSKNKMFVGIDYSYHESINAFQRNNLIEPGNEGALSYKSAIFVGNEYLFGRVGVMLQMGFYLKQGALKQDPYYQKIGGNYYIIQKEKGPIKELFLTGLLKTHKSIAELAEFGVGFGF